MALNNPAARLHNILTLCRSINKEMSNKPMMQGWRKVLRLTDKDEDIVVMSRIGRVFILPSQIAAEISRYPDIDATLFLSWHGDMSKAFQKIGFTNAFNEFNAHVSDSLLLAVQFCSHELSKRCPEKIIEESQIQSLKDEVYKLYVDIINANLDPVLSRYLLDHIYMIIDAVDNYLITGARGLQTAVDTAIGTFFTNNSMAEQATNTEAGRSFWKTVKKSSLLLDVAFKTYQLGTGLGKMLGGE